MINQIGKFLFLIRKAAQKFEKEYVKSQFKEIGKEVYIGERCVFTPKTICIGDDVYVGQNCCFQSLHGEIRIGSHVMFGPNVHIHGGNHKIHEVGVLLKHTSPKSAGEDGFVTIEDDCWIGANAMILKGVTIGRGSVVGGGTIVTHDVSPYSICTNKIIPVVRSRFNEGEQREHERKLEQSEKNKSVE